MQVPQLAEGLALCLARADDRGGEPDGRGALGRTAARRGRASMLPATLTQVGALAVDGLGDLWIGGPEGVFYSTDSGATLARL